MPRLHCSNPPMKACNPRKIVYPWLEQSSEGGPKVCPTSPVSTSSGSREKLRRPTALSSVVIAAEPTSGTCETLLKVDRWPTEEDACHWGSSCHLYGWKSTLFETTKQTSIQKQGWDKLGVPIEACPINGALAFSWNQTNGSIWNHESRFSWDFKSDSWLMPNCDATI